MFEECHGFYKKIKNKKSCAAVGAAIGAYGGGIAGGVSSSVCLYGAPACASGSVPAGAAIGAGAGAATGFAVCKGDDDEREKQCDYQYYKVDIPTCRGIGRQRGKNAKKRAALCYASANDRYAACLRGQHPLPPLITWNN